MTVALAPPSAIAFLGVGKMGAPMAGHLVAAGWQVTAFDPSVAALDGFLARNPLARRARSAAEAAEGAEVVVTMLPDGEVVRRVLIADGAAAAMRRRGVVVDMSSSAPMGTRSVGDELARMELEMLDAPVSGGVQRAIAGKLAIMVGGDAGTVHRCRPVLSAMGSAIYETGPLGSGHAMKALNNFVSAAGLVATCEALLVGRAFGLDPSVMVDVLNGSTGRNNSTEHKAKQFILSETFGSGFALALMAKDLRAAAELAARLDVHGPLAPAMARLWTDAETALGRGGDHTEIFRYLRGLGPGGA